MELILTIFVALLVVSNLWLWRTLHKFNKAIYNLDVKLTNWIDYPEEQK